MNTVTTTSSRRTKGMAQAALFAALIFLMSFTPFLGYIPLGFTRATIVHIPVILGSLLLGPKKGAFLGGIFGLTSFLNNTFNPTPTSFVFTPFYSLGEISGGPASLAVCFLPRIFVGVAPWFVYRAVRRLDRREGVSVPGLALAGVAGSLVNTLLVLNLIFLFFGDSYAAASRAARTGYGFILSLIGVNGIPEAIIAGALAVLAGRVLMKNSVMQRLGLK